jgi:hypothetical protein
MAQKHNQHETQNAPMTRLGDLKLYAQQRIIRGTAFLSTSFTADNPILQLGELGYETDTNKLKIGDGVTAWNDLAYAGGGDSAVKVNTTVTLAAADWSDNAQTVSVTGITADGVVFVSPDPTDQADYTSAGIYCSAQAAGTLTFTCSTTPANDIDVVVVML